VEIEEAMADVGGCELHYQRLGEGPPIVFVHGGMVLDSSNFLPHVGTLAQWFTIIIYDQAGRGKSSEREDITNISIMDDVDDLDRLRQALGFHEWTVAGHSWGGVIGGLYASKFPASVDTLIMIAPVGSHYPAWQKPWILRTLDMLPEENRQVFESILKDWELRKEDPEEYFTRYFTSIHPAWFGDQSWAEKIPVHEVRARTGGAVWDSLRGYDFRDLFREISADTIIVQGTRDAVPMSSTHEIRDLIKGSRLVELQGIGHYPFIEDRDRFIEIVKEFMG
jgi:proline iminopeptidase